MPSGSSTIRRAALLRDRGLCCNCSQPADHTHHIVPIHLGGQDVLSNVVAICQSCHGKVHGFGYGLDHRAATKAGVERARAAGKVIGRKPSYTDEQAWLARRLNAEGRGVSYIASVTSLSRGAVYRLLQEVANPTPQEAS
jgi:hypothetical protein